MHLLSLSIVPFQEIFVFMIFNKNRLFYHNLLCRSVASSDLISPCF